MALVTDALARTGRDHDPAHAHRLVALADGLLMTGLVAGDGRAAEHAREGLVADLAR